MAEIECFIANNWSVVWLINLTFCRSNTLNYPHPYREKQRRWGAPLTCWKCQMIRHQTRLVGEHWAGWRIAFHTTQNSPCPFTNLKGPVRWRELCQEADTKTVTLNLGWLIMDHKELTKSNSLREDTWLPSADAERWNRLAWKKHQRALGLLIFINKTLWEPYE